MSENKLVEYLIKTALEEDLGPGDITCQAIPDLDKKGSASIYAKQNGILSGIDVATQVFRFTDDSLNMQVLRKEGDGILSGDAVLNIKGQLSAILSAERTALNFLAHLSGVATKTSLFVDRIAGFNTKITDTRKTTPAMRFLEKRAVKSGGGVNHRSGLYDMILIKENHIEAAGNITQAVKRCKDHLAKINKNIKIEVEVKNLSEVEESLHLNVDRIMLDNMTNKMMTEAVRMIAGRAEVEASGGVSFENVLQIAQSGVDYISVGALTHSAPAFDFTLLVD
jgi:nicotinate-nucleotide pyrophosphorylase (carboxylating)